MSSAGVFKLITNDGAQDKLLMATSLLNDRLKEIRRIRCKNPLVGGDTTPTLVDIERTHLLFINAHFKPFCAIGYEYQIVQPQFNLLDFGRQITFSIPQFGDFFHDMVVNVQLTGLAAIEPNDKVYYCDFLGHRLFQQVQFEVNGNFLDQYDSNVMNFHYNFFLPAHKKLAWLRSVGQEVPQEAFLVHNTAADEYRQQMLITDGPQTPKVAHPTISLWIPLLFWFNKDPRLSIPSISIPYGQRFMRISLADISLLTASVRGAMFQQPFIEVCTMYINNIFLNPEIHNIFIRRVGFTMIRVHMQQRVPESNISGQIQLFKFKYPIETIYLGLQPNINATGPDQMTDWWRYHNVTTHTFPVPVAIPNPAFTSGGPPVPEYVLAFSHVVRRIPSRTIDTLQLVNHGVILYDITPVEFFSEYLPYNYGDRISSPEDIGLAMITFNLYPGSYQPSGHFNLSQARETYLNWTGATISSVNLATMYLVGIAINFLLIAEGTCVLRFNT